MWDIKWTDDYDFAFTQDVNGESDILRTIDEEAYAQIIKNRLISVHPDWFYDNKGADLELLLGEPNTVDTAERGISLIRNVLSEDGFVPSSNLYIKPAPVNADTVVFFCFIKSPYSDAKLTFQTEICLSGDVNVVIIKK